jgi:soluble cytochrome b562
MTPAESREYDSEKNHMSLGFRGSNSIKQSQSKMSYKEIMNSPEMKNYRRKMERRLSGLDKIELK